jgi:iron(III) transport system substrate-binding protein
VSVYRVGLKGWVSSTLVAGLLIVGTGLLAACGDSGLSVGSITLYNGQHEATTDALVAGFEKASGIQVNVRNDDEDTFVSQILTEGSRSPADVFYTENSPPLAELAERGLLAPVDAASLAQTPRAYSPGGGDWEGVSARVSVLIWNPSLIAGSQLPTSVLQLADPRYRGKLAFAAGETDFQPIVTSVLRSAGAAVATRWLAGIKANSAGHVYPDNETIADQVNRGAVAFGVVNQYYWYRMQAQLGASKTASRISYFAPRDPGYVLDVSGAGILKSSTHQVAARKFLAYLTSKAGQQIIAHSSSFEYPLGSGVTVVAGAQIPFAQLKPNPITIGELGDGSSAIALLTKAGLQ